jgi:predicted anti-sigma-YlaC factor YlaD
MTMDCDSCKNSLQAYLDGELDGSRFAEIEHHLQQCPQCKAELDRLVKMRGLLRDIKDVEVPAGERETFIRALRDRIESEQVRTQVPQKQGSWRPALVFAIVVVLVLIVLVYIPGDSRSTKIAPAPGLSAVENSGIDLMIMGGLTNYYLATQEDLLADPSTTGGQIIVGWKVMKDTYGDILLPAE